MPVCRSCPHLEIMFPEDSLSRWEQSAHWKKDQEDNMIMLRCEICGKDPFLRPADCPRDLEVCYNEP
jgi:hypothetical protein